MDCPPLPQGRPRTALVLGAGGIKSVCHVGLIRVLQRERIPIDLVVGSSGGAVIGAAFAMGAEASQIEQWIREHWQRNVLRDWSLARMLRAWIPMRPRLDEGFGLAKGDALLAALVRLFGRHTFEETVIPIQIVASDLLTGEAVAFTDGPLVDALRASVSVPFFIQPYRVGRRCFVDGALTAPIPLEFAIGEDVDIILWMGFGARLRKWIGSPFGFIRRLVQIPQTQLYRASQAYCARIAALATVPMEVFVDEELGLCDVDAIPRLIQLGEKVAEAELRGLERLLSEFPRRHDRLASDGRSWKPRFSSSALEPGTVRDPVGQPPGLLDKCSSSAGAGCMDPSAARRG